MDIGKEKNVKESCYLGISEKISISMPSSSGISTCSDAVPARGTVARALDGGWRHFS